MAHAFVTGASRGVGRGIAIALAEAGYDVFATGRTVANADLPAKIVCIPCDHRDDVQTAAAFVRLAEMTDRLDILVNAAWGGYERMVENGSFTWSAPFWEQPSHRWDGMIDAGVRPAFVCSCHATRIMLPRQRGLIVNLGFWAAQKYLGNVIYGIAKAATDKMTSDMAYELRPNGIACISLYPGLVRTEAVLRAATSGAFDLSNSESPQFIGRVVAALADEPGLLNRSGKSIVAAAIALELGVRDVDGRQPMPLSIESA